ncbi:MAG: hypothetical protein AAGE01_04805 [Pseudomonadota bacterium]
MNRIIAAALGLTFVGVVGAIDIEREERIELKIAADGAAPEVIVLDDFENFPIGATETVRTEAGTEALVTRLEDRVLLELNGEQFEIAMPDPERLHGNVFLHDDADVIIEELGEGAHVVEKHVIIRSDAEFHDDVDGETIVIDLGEDGEWVSADEGLRHRVIVRSNESLEAHGDHEAKVFVVKRKSDETR